MSEEFWYPKGDDNPCNGCGVCCSHFRISFYQGEIKSLGGTVPDEHTVQITPYLVAIKGTENGKGRCSCLDADGMCGIYENRPSCCREFPAIMEDGTQNPKCIELKKMYGVERRAQ